MILTNDQIVEAYRKQDIIIDPFDDKQIQGASYDLRVGHQGITTTTKELIDLSKKGFLLLEPGDFAVVLTFEEIKLGPQHTARFGLRSRYARSGVIASTGPQIDPGYEGKLIVGLANLSPKAISIPYRDDFLSVEFHRLEQPSTRSYQGPYQRRRELGPEEIRSIVEAESMALPEVLKTLQSLNASVGAITTRFDDVAHRLEKVENMHSDALKRQNQILLGLALAVIGLLARLVLFR